MDIEIFKHELFLKYSIVFSLPKLPQFTLFSYKILIFKKLWTRVELASKSWREKWLTPTLIVYIISNEYQKSFTSKYEERFESLLINSKNNSNDFSFIKST